MKKSIKIIIISAITVMVAALSSCSLKTMIEQAKCEHDYGANATQVVKVATCKEQGEELWTCTKCGKEKTEETVKTEHSYVEEKVITAATCKTSGETLYVCEICRHEKTELTAKLAHTTVNVAAVAATCTEAGYTDYSYCSVCNVFLVPKTAIPAKGHVSVTDMGYFETCTETGLTAGSHCKNCNVVLTAQEVIPAKGHTLVTVEGYAATCTTAGLTDGQKCSSCGVVYTEQEEIPASHVGIVGSNCELCGEYIFSANSTSYTLEPATSGESAVGNWYRVYLNYYDEETQESYLSSSFAIGHILFSSNGTTFFEGISPDCVGVESIFDKCFKGSDSGGAYVCFFVEEGSSFTYTVAGESYSEAISDDATITFSSGCVVYRVIPQ